VLVVVGGIIPTSTSAVEGSGHRRRLPAWQPMQDIIDFISKHARPRLERV